MGNFINKSGIIGGDLPNVYIDEIQINKINSRLLLSCYQRKTNRSNHETGNNIRIKVIEIKNLNSFRDISKMENLKLIMDLRENSFSDIKISDFSFSEMKDFSLPSYLISEESVLQRKIKELDIKTQNVNNNFLYYIVISYFYDQNSARMSAINKSVFSNKTIEEVITQGAVSQYQKEYYIKGSNIRWFGNVKEQNKSYYTDNKDNLLLEQKIVQNKKVKILFDSRSSGQTKPPGFGQTNFNFQQNSRSTAQQNASVLTGQNTANQAIEAAQNNLVTLMEEQNYSNTHISKTADKAYQEFISEKPFFKPEDTFLQKNSNNKVSIKFSLDFDQIILNNFSNKSYINPRHKMLNFLNQQKAIVVKEINLIKKIVPNKNQFQNNININQQEIFCTNIYMSTQQQRNVNVYDYAMEDTAEQYQKYDYFVEIKFENIINNLILNEILKLKNNKITLLEYYDIFKQYYKNKETTGDQVINYYNTTIISVINNYSAAYSLIYNLDDNQEQIKNSEITNLLRPNSINTQSSGIGANEFSIKTFIQIFENLINEYQTLYYSISSSVKSSNKFVYSSIFKINSANLTENFLSDINNTKTSYFNYRKKIQEATITQAPKNITINYISNLNNSIISIENFVSRIKQEKGRLFSDNINYSKNYMFSYLSPDIIVDNINSQNLVLSSSQENLIQEVFTSNVESQNKKELQLNAIISQGNLFNTTNNSGFVYEESENENFSNENISNLLNTNSISYFSKKFGLTLETRGANKKAITDKIVNLGKVIEFNNMFNVDIPANIEGMPNHMIKVREKNINLLTYSSIFDYRILMEIHCEINNQYVLLTKDILLNSIERNLYFLKCKMVPHFYLYNQNIKYDISKISDLQLKDFAIGLNTQGINRQLIKDLINSV